MSVNEALNACKCDCCKAFKVRFKKHLKNMYFTKLMAKKKIEKENLSPEEIVSLYNHQKMDAEFWRVVVNG